MQSFQEAIASKRILIGDGAMGTELFAQGLDQSVPCERWLLEAPEAVRQIHRGYIEAGSDWILTNTFGANPFRLEEAGLADQTEHLNHEAVRLAREAAEDTTYVVGDIGPCGHYLEPHGEMTASQLREGFSRQISALLDAGVDGLMIETMMDVEEMAVVLEEAVSLADCPVLASMTFQQGPQGIHTMCGAHPTDAARRLDKLGASAIGSNCMFGVETFPALIMEIRIGANKPLLAKPNAGQPQLINGRATYPESAEHMAAWMPRIYEAGATLLGGCCGTTPDLIRALRAWAESLPND